MDPKEIVRQGFDAASTAYRADDASEAEFGPWLADLASHLPEGASVLDLGCGCGVPTARWLVQRGFTVLGVDLSPVQIERARQLVPEAEFHCADITTVDLPAASIDAVVALYSIIHVPIEEQPNLFATIHDWLRPGGWLLATLGARRWTGTEDNWLDAGATMYWSHTDAATYLQWLAKAGFCVEWNRFVPEGQGGHTLVLAHT